MTKRIVVTSMLEKHFPVDPTMCTRCALVSVAKNVLPTDNNITIRFLIYYNQPSFVFVLMKTSKFTETQIVAILKQADAGVPVKDVCRQAGISVPTYYKWKSKYGGLEASELRRVKELEAENAKLKRMYAELALDNAAMKDLIAKKL